MTKDLRKAVEADEGASQLLHSLRDLIQNARQRALRAVDAVQVQNRLSEPRLCSKIVNIWRVRPLCFSEPGVPSEPFSIQRGHECAAIATSYLKPMHNLVNSPCNQVLWRAKPCRF
jgi:hypothetical protein